MIFSPPEINKNIPIMGKIARIDTNRIGVKFDGLLSDMWHVGEPPSEGG
jgi:hypothetical protein